jgi:crotonobetainyl-CoA:carnitine CoA-transferase CaiB-like acyl-CoA transferase
MSVFHLLKQGPKIFNTLYNLVRKSVVKKTNKEWVEVLQKAEIPFGVVNRLEDLKDDPQLKSLDFFREYNHPTEGKLEIPDSAFRI